MKKITQLNPACQSKFSTNLHPVLQRVFANRGIQEEAELNLTLARLIPASQLKGLDQALPILAGAIWQQKKILIIGDFDADGATSSALTVLALRRMGALNVDYLVPNRFEFGYGLTPEIVAVAKQREPDLIITVDNGISSCAGVAAAKALGMQVVVTDHHLPGSETPRADAIINPNQHGCEFPSKHLAGVGVAFYVLTALRSYLQEQGWFAQQKLGVPNMADYLDIVALGTVADVVPLDYNNRILVQQGLQRIRAGRCRPGIRALAQIAKRDLKRLVAADLGFALAPRLNAAGRLTDMSKGIECLLAEDEATALEYAQTLDQLNYERRAIEGQMQSQALTALERMEWGDSDQLPWGLCLYEPDWHQGVIGILASRIKDKLHRPCIAFARGDSGELKGSARSIPGLHIRDTLDAVATNQPGLIGKFGGHAMAAGLSLPAEHLTQFRAAFDHEVRNRLTLKDLTGEIFSDGALAEAHIDLPLAAEIRQSGPWGQGFPEPVFDGEFELLNQRIVGEKHLKLVLGLPSTGRVIDAIAFNVDLAQWPNNQANRVYLAYKLDVNEYRGVTSPQLMVEHLMKV